MPASPTDCYFLRQCRWLKALQTTEMTIVLLLPWLLFSLNLDFAFLLCFTVQLPSNLSWMRGVFKLAAPGLTSVFVENRTISTFILCRLRPTAFDVVLSPQQAQARRWWMGSLKFAMGLSLLSYESCRLKRSLFAFKLFGGSFIFINRSP